MTYSPWGTRIPPICIMNCTREPKCDESLMYMAGRFGVCDRREFDLDKLLGKENIDDNDDLS